MRKEYRNHVIDYFRNQYIAGRTPNPCIICNKMLKFGFLLEKAKAAGIDFDLFATGHYARMEESDGRFMLKKAKDLSFVLFIYPILISLEFLNYLFFNFSWKMIGGRYLSQSDNNIRKYIKHIGDIVLVIHPS
jgi:tRNA U34 2-thiouridine synthase MnmA/TrmU